MNTSQPDRHIGSDGNTISGGRVEHSVRAGQVEGLAPWMGDTPPLSHTATADNSYEAYLRWCQHQQPPQPKQQFQQQQLFYRDGSPYNPQQLLGQGQAQHSAQHTLQSGLASAGLTTAALGLLDGDVNGLFSTQTNAQGMPDTDWLKNLRLMSDTSKRKRSTNKLRPDCYIDVDKLYHEMSFQELVNGMNGVLDYIIKANLPRITLAGYRSHMSFITLKGQGGAFGPDQLARYDHEVVSRVLKGELSDFIAGDVRSVQAHLSAEHMIVAKRMMSGSSPQTGSSQSGSGGGRGRRRRNRGPRFDRQMSDWPPEFCWKWNNTECNFNPCYKKHACGECNGQHKSRDCRTGSDSSGGHYQPQQQQQHQQQHQQHQQQHQQGRP